jgi:hypothetical protein
MNPKLLSAVRLLESPTRNLDAIIVPLATGGGRGIETPEEMLVANLRLAMRRMVEAISAAEKTL